MRRDQISIGMNVLIPTGAQACYGYGPHEFIPGRVIDIVQERVAIVRFRDKAQKTCEGRLAILSLESETSSGRRIGALSFQKI